MYGGRITSEEKSTLGKYIGLILVTALGAGGIYFFFLTQETNQPIGFDPNRPVPSDAILKRRLKPEQYHSCAKTAPMPYQRILEHDRPGIYVDVLRTNALTSVDKSIHLACDLQQANLERSPGRESRHFAGLQRPGARKRKHAHLATSLKTRSRERKRYVLNSAAFFSFRDRMRLEHYEAYLPLLRKNNERSRSVRSMPQTAGRLTFLHSADRPPG